MKLLYVVYCIVDEQKKKKLHTSHVAFSQTVFIKLIQGISDG